MVLALYCPQFEVVYVCEEVALRYGGQAKRQEPTKNQIEKFVKLTDHACACNDLTSFKYEKHEITGNGSYLNMQKLA